MDIFYELRNSIGAFLWWFVDYDLVALRSSSHCNIPLYQRIMDPDLVVFTLFNMKIKVASKIPWRRSQGLTATWWSPSRRLPTGGGRSPTTLFPSWVLLPLSSQLAFLLIKQVLLHGGSRTGRKKLPTFCAILSGDSLPLSSSCSHSSSWTPFIKRNRYWLSQLTQPAPVKPECTVGSFTKAILFCKFIMQKVILGLGASRNSFQKMRFSQICLLP